MERVRNFFPDDTSTKQTGWLFGWISDFTELNGLVDYPWRALKRGLDLQITYTRPLRRTTWQSGCRFFNDLMDAATFMSKMGKREGKNRSGQGLSMGKLTYPSRAKAPQTRESANLPKDLPGLAHPAGTGDLDRAGIYAKESRRPTPRQICPSPGT